MGGRAGGARVADDERGVVLFLGLQYMLQPDRMRVRRVGADHEDGARIVNVVEAVRQRAVAPGVGNTRDGGRVTDTRLVVTVVGAPEGVELPDKEGQIGRASCMARVWQ